MDPDGPLPLHARIRWGNVARATALLALTLLVLAWPHLRAPEPALPPASADPRRPGRPRRHRPQPPPPPPSPRHDADPQPAPTPHAPARPAGRRARAASARTPREARAAGHPQPPRPARATAPRKADTTTASTPTPSDDPTAGAPEFAFESTRRGRVQGVEPRFTAGRSTTPHADTQDPKGGATPCTLPRAPEPGYRPTAAAIEAPFASMSANCSSIQSPGSRAVTAPFRPAARRSRSSALIVKAR